MDLIEPNNDLTSHKISLCIILQESLTNPGISTKIRLKIHTFLLNKLLEITSTEPPLKDLLHELHIVERSSPSYFSESIVDILVRSLKGLQDHNDLLVLFNVKLSELLSDGDVNLGYLEEGGVLYLFLRHCFLVFARLDYQGLISLAEQLVQYKRGFEESDMEPVMEVLPESQKEAFVYKFSSRLNHAITQETYLEITKKIKNLKDDASHILQGNLDLLYKKPTAIDHLHKYFDLVLDKKMPTKVNRERGLVVVKSSTHYASLQRVRYELELGKTETALNLLVETIKRALSENDRKIMLESIMLFCQVAGLLGNLKNEMKLVETCILKSLDAQHIPSLIFSCLQYSMLNIWANPPNRKDIDTAITPQAPTVKPGMPKPRMSDIDPNVKTCVKLQDYCSRFMLTNNKYTSYRQKLLQVKALTWHSLGQRRLLRASLPSLELADKDNANFYLQLARLACKDNKQHTLDILNQIDFRCPVKQCIDWDVTVLYILHTWAVWRGMWNETDWIWERLRKDVDKVKHARLYSEIMNARCERLLLEGDVDGALNFFESQIKFNDENSILNDWVLMSKIFSACEEHYKALDYALSIDTLESKIRQAEILLEILPSPLKALTMLNEIRTQVVEETTVYTRSCYFLVLTECKFKLASRLGEQGLTRHIIAHALRDLNMAIDGFENLHCDILLRECLYFQARGRHDLGLLESRDLAAQSFNEFNYQLNWMAKSCILQSMANVDITCLEKIDRKFNARAMDVPSECLLVN